MALGDFSPSRMPAVLATLEDSMTDSRVQQRQKLMPPSKIIDFVVGLQTAEWDSVRPADRYCQEFSVTWLEESDTKATLRTNQQRLDATVCTFDGEELQSNKKNYLIDKVIDTVVKIRDSDCGDMFSTGSKMALALLQGQKKLIARLAEALPAYIYAYAGANTANGIGFDGNIGVADATNPFTSIAKADATTEKVLPYLMYMATFSKLQNPKMIDGGMLTLERIKSAMEEGVGENYWTLAQYNEDILNMYAGGFMNWAFIVDNGNLALPVQSFFPELGGDNELMDGMYRYSIPLAGANFGGEQWYIDVTYTKELETIAGTNKCELVHNFLLELKFNLWQAPRYASDTVTGVIALKKAA